MTKIKGKWTMIANRLFPGYVFVETERIEDFFMRLKQIEGMTKVLCTGEDMTPIEPEEEEYLLRTGDSVRIMPGRLHKLRNDYEQVAVCINMKCKVNY